MTYQRLAISFHIISNIACNIFCQGYKSGKCYYDVIFKEMAKNELQRIFYFNFQGLSFKKL